ncbi:MAG: hypothetical protein O3C05_00355 [Proteobacteria bacterium]|nr:hypothetical protein [Pseudomonadota bacterium]
MRLNIALGNFDGMHIGHAEIIKYCVFSANEDFATPAAMVFKPHPQVILKGAKVTKILQDEKRNHLMFNIGIREIYELTFTKNIALMSADSFFSDILLKISNINKIVTGYNFRCGNKKEAGIEQLSLRGKKEGFEVCAIREITYHKQKTSSTIIRTLIDMGSVDIASKMLQRHYSMSGTVIHGNKTGRVLGYKTANIEFEKDMITPLHGVYIVKIRIYSSKNEYLNRYCHFANEKLNINSHEISIYKKSANYKNLDTIKTHYGVVNFGKRPTFGDLETRLEVHILDFDSDIYGAYVDLDFISLIRPERKYENKKQLSDQIALDVKFTKYARDNEDIFMNA